MNTQYPDLRFWFINCRGVMEDIIMLKKRTKDYDIILSHMNNFDMERLLHCENVRLRMDGYKFERSMHSLIDIINFDVVEYLYFDYKDCMEMLHW